MNTKHTPGPWEVSHTDQCTYVGATEMCIAEIFDESEGSYEANARLIAAAPELLAALRTIHEAALRISTGGSLLDDKGFNTLAHPVSVAEAAIAKATTPNTPNQ